MRPAQSSPAGYQQMEQVNPLSPNIRMHFLLTVSLYISYDTGWENLCKNQDILSLMIVSFILMTCMFRQVMIL